MKKGGTGGANTGAGLLFENRVSLEKLFHRLIGYSVVESGKTGLSVKYRGQEVARLFKKHKLYKYLEEEFIYWRSIISKRLLPDDAMLVMANRTLFIVEVKFQNVAGSVDEKLQTCDFKRSSMRN